VKEFQSVQICILCEQEEMGDKKPTEKTVYFQCHFIGRDGLQDYFPWGVTACVNEPTNYTPVPLDLYPGVIMESIHETFGSDAIGCTLIMFPLANVPPLVLIDGVIWSDERPFYDGSLQNNKCYVIVYSTNCIPSGYTN
jgi:hypothetical protein